MYMHAYANMQVCRVHVWCLPLCVPANLGFCRFVCASTPRACKLATAPPIWVLGGWTHFVMLFGEYCTHVSVPDQKVVRKMTMCSGEITNTLPHSMQIQFLTKIHALYEIVANCWYANRKYERRNFHISSNGFKFLFISAPGFKKSSQVAEIYWNLGDE